MYDFLDFVKKYIEDEFKNDADYADVDFTVEHGKDYNAEVAFPQITLSGIANEENQQFSDFQDERVTTYGLQVTWFTDITIIGNEVYEPLQSALKIGDKIKSIFNKLRNEMSNRNILSMRRVGSQVINPYSAGSQLYYGVTRFNFNIANPYVK